MEIKDIVAIIKACRANGVDELVYDKFRLVMSKNSLEVLEQPITSPKPVKIPATVALQNIEAIAKEEAEKELAQEIDELLINDPLTYETLLANGEIVDEPQVQH